MPLAQEKTNRNLLLELQWIEGIRRGDAKAFERLFHEYYSGLFRFVWHYVKSSESAKEIVQDVFARIWERREEFNPHRSPKAYIFTMAKNLALDHLRHERVVHEWAEDPAVLFPRESQSLEDQINQKLLLEDLQKAISHLPERCRMAFILSRYDGLSYSEIAQIMGVSVKTVDTQISRALRVLRKYLLPHLSTIAFLAFLKETL
jgi:RNA polymerase sigma-70 factor (ECF subfamily)